MPTELPRGRVVVKELLKPADKSVSHPVVAATDDGTTRKETASGSNIGPMRDRDVWSSPVWIMGGAVALLTTGTMQSRRERRYELSLRRREKNQREMLKELEQGPDLSTTEFSARNAFFFSHLSGIIYSPKDVSERAMRALGISDFFWFAPPDEADRSPFGHIADTQAAVVATPEWIALIFRGTQEGADWVTNLKFLQKDFPRLGKVHEGFSEGLNTVWHGEGMLDKILDLTKECPRPIYIAGHSLGAALATVAAARITVEHDLPLAALYTVGSPRVFDTRAAFAYDAWINDGSTLEQKCFRGVNNNDVVTSVPPDTMFEVQGINYQHVGTKVYINRSGSLETGEFWDGLRGHWEALLRGAFLDAIDDHDVAKYAEAFRRAAKKAAMNPFKRAATDIIHAGFLRPAASAVHIAENVLDAADVAEQDASPVEGLHAVRRDL